MKGRPSKNRDAAGSAVPSVRVLKSASCKSLSGRSTLGYEVGAERDGEIHLRIRSNSGSGCFGRDWTPLRTLQQALAKAPEAITSGTLNRVFAGKSQNTGGFVLAALFHEGLLKPLADARGYAPTDGVEFMKELKRLLAKGDVAPPTKKADAAMPSAKKASAPSKGKVARK